MESINCAFFSSPVFNGDASSNYIGNHTFIQQPDLSIKNPYSHWFDPVQISGVIDYKNIKPNCTYRSRRNEGVISSKKAIHKFMERKRRLDMKTLYSELTSLLPEEYIRGKRSIAEHLSEAIEYIKHLEHRVKELTQKTEETRKEILGEDLTFSVASETLPTVKVICEGSAVFVSTNTIKCDMFFSDLLLTLEDDGLDIVSSASSAMNGKVFHTIQAKILDLQRFDKRSLHQKIWKFVRERSSNAKAYQR